MTIRVPNWYRVVVWAHPFDFIRFRKRNDVLFIQCNVSLVGDFQDAIDVDHVIFSDDAAEAYGLAKEIADSTSRTRERTTLTQVTTICIASSAA